MLSRSVQPNLGRTPHSFHRASTSGSSAASGPAPSRLARLVARKRAATSSPETTTARNANKTDDKAEQAARVEAVAATGEPAEDNADERSCGDQKRREGARQSQLRVADEEPWERHLDHCVHDDPLPVTQRGPEAPTCQ